MSFLWQDLQYSVRSLRRSPLFSIIAILSLALGIGANTAIFTLLDQLLLRMLPIQSPDEIVQVASSGSHYGSNQGRDMLSYPMYRDLRDKNETLAGLIARREDSFTVSHGSESERALGEIVSGNYFQVLGVGAAVGRVLTAADDRTPGGHPVAVLAYEYWQSRFNGDPKVVGQKIFINNYPMSIVGVSAAGFAGLSPGILPKIRLPLAMRKEINPRAGQLEDRRTRWVQVFGRRKAGMTNDQVKANLQTVFRQVIGMEVTEKGFATASRFSRDKFLQMSIRVMPGAQGASNLRRQMERPLQVLMGIVGLVLLIACANLANLLIARASAREKEIAIRLSIGATRGRIVRLLLVESSLLALAGAVLSIFLARWGVKGLLAMLPSQGSDSVNLSADPDWRILAFNFAIAFAAGLAFGLVPALQATRQTVALKPNSSAWLRKALVVTQVSLSLLLLIGAGLFLKSLQNLKSLNPGFAVSNLVTFMIDPGLSGYKPERAETFYRELNRRLSATPGVESASLAVVPVLRGWEWDSTVTVEGHQAKQGEDMNPHVNILAPGYFNTMGIKLLAGRDFDDRDSQTSGKKVLINDKMAKLYFPRGDALGRHIGWGGDPGTKTEIEIIGVVSDTKYEGFREETPRIVYRGYFQEGWASDMAGYIRTSLPPEQMFNVVRSIVQDLDPKMPIYDMRTLEQQLDQSLANERLVAMLSSLFGLLATCLALIGLYGVMAYTVARRTREIGIRMALGAEAGNVVWLVMREVVAMVGAGLLIALPLAWFASRHVQSQLYGLQPQDPITVGAATAALATVALLAGYLPAARAAKIDPMTALRYE